MKDSKLKNWPMPQAVKNEDWGCAKAGTTDNKLNDRKSGIDSMESHNAKITKRQTPKKWG